jgi:5-methylcytosine-specific restriction endonuclease McrA
MKPNANRDKALLLKTGQAVVEQLWERTEGTRMKLRWPSRVGMVNTGGWRVKLGNLGKSQPQLQIWLDFFAGCDSRKFNFCYFGNNVVSMRKFADKVAKVLPVYRRITDKDMDKHGGDFYYLKKHLRRKDFLAAFLEEYWGEWSYFGIYDPTVRSEANDVNPQLIARAADFFEDVARAQPGIMERDTNREVYPRIENRKVVISHLRRERSGYLATERKNHDDYKCQVCGMRFEEVYGKLGERYAEAHHIVPLGKLKGEVKTTIEALRTVCANCHRMLHKMKGERGDMDKLRAIIANHKRKNAR